MLDTHYAEPGPGDVFGVIPEKGVYLLHGVNKGGWIAGATYAQPSRRLYHALYDVWGFLNDNPNEVVTIFLEDYTTAEQLDAEFTFIADKETKEGRDGQKFLQRIYNPANDSNWRVKEKKQWPLLSDLIAWDKRVIIFSNDIKKSGSNYVAYGRDYTKENYWSLDALGNKWDCPSRWDDGEYKDADYPKLFVFSHYRDTPTVITAAIDNHYDKIMDRINNQCCKTAKQLPNFVAADFFEVPLGESKAQDAVTELNRRWQNNEGCKQCDRRFHRVLKHTLHPPSDFPLNDLMMVGQRQHNPPFKILLISIARNTFMKNQKFQGNSKEGDFQSALLEATIEIGKYIAIRTSN